MIEIIEGLAEGERIVRNARPDLEEDQYVKS